MKIGLYDVDLLSNLKKPRFNLEVMKLATYYMSQGHTCELLLPDDFINLDIYDKFVMRKDWRDSVIDPRFTITKDVSWGGLALEGKYCPLEPWEANLMAPQTAIYNRYFEYASEKKLIPDSVMMQFFKTNHFRLYLDEGIIATPYWFTYISPILLYDSDIGHNAQWTSQIKRLDEQTRYKVKFVHPVIFTEDNLNDLEAFFSLDCVSLLHTEVLFDINQDINKFVSFILKNESVLQKRGRFTIYLDKNYLSENPTQFDINQLFLVINKYLYCRSRGLNLQVKIFDENKYINKESTLLIGVKNWINNSLNWNDSLYYYFKRKKQGGALKILDEQLKGNDSLIYQLLYTRPSQIKKGGYWPYDYE